MWQNLHNLLIMTNFESNVSIVALIVTAVFAKLLHVFLYQQNSTIDSVSSNISHTAGRLLRSAPQRVSHTDEGDGEGTATHDGTEEHEQNLGDDRHPLDDSDDECLVTAEWLMSNTLVRPTLGIVCGSGFSGLASMLKDVQVFRYSDIPNVPLTTVKGHIGRLLFGTLRGKQCVCMQGRFHLYEGYPIQTVTLFIRVFKLMGVDTMILTNAAGGLNQDYSAGDVMIIKDHFNMPGFAGISPLIGHNNDRFGVRFPCMSEAYDIELRQLARNVAAELGYSDFLQEGVYCYVGGPSLETIAESRMLHNLGADAVGMSTIPEVVVARHAGMRCFAMSLISNRAVLDYDDEERSEREEALKMSRLRAKQLEKLVSTMVARMEDSSNNLSRRGFMRGFFKSQQAYDGFVVM